MTNKLAKIISYLFHPIFLPFYFFIFLYYISPSSLYLNAFSIRNFFTLSLIILIYTCIFPILLVYWLFKKNHISSLHIDQRNERPKVYFLIAGFYLALSYFLFAKGGILKPTSIILILMSTNIIGLGLISFISKISAHIAAISGTLGICLMLNINFDEGSLFKPIIYILILTGFIASSRLKLGAHTLNQILLGFFWGLFNSIIGFIFLF